MRVCCKLGGYAILYPFSWMEEQHKILVLCIFCKKKLRTFYTIRDTIHEERGFWVQIHLSFPGFCEAQVFGSCMQWVTCNFVSYINVGTCTCIYMYMYMCIQGGGPTVYECYIHVHVWIIMQYNNNASYSRTWFVMWKQIGNEYCSSLYGLTVYLK